MKLEIISELHAALSQFNHPPPTDPDKWLRGADAKEMIGGISETTLYEMRCKGYLKGSRIMGTWYYKVSDIKKMMEEYKVE